MFSEKLSKESQRFAEGGDSVKRRVLRFFQHYHWGFYLHLVFGGGVMSVKKKLAGRLKMLAECIVAVGTMLIPLAIVLLTTVKNFSVTLAQNLILIGAVALATGIVLAVRNEVRESQKSKRIEQREKLRRRVDKMNLLIIAHTAEKLGVDMNKVYDAAKKELDKDESDIGY
jgi:hypothetical protein